MALEGYVNVYECDFFFIIVLKRESFQYSGTQERWCLTGISREFEFACRNYPFAFTKNTYCAVERNCIVYKIYILFHQRNSAQIYTGRFYLTAILKNKFKYVRK